MKRNIYIDFDNFDMESLTDYIQEPIKKKYKKRFDLSELNTLPKIEEFEKELDKQLKQLKQLKKTLMELKKLIPKQPKEQYIRLNSNMILLLRNK